MLAIYMYIYYIMVHARYAYTTYMIDMNMIGVHMIVYNNNIIIHDTIRGKISSRGLVKA